MTWHDVTWHELTWCVGQLRPSMSAERGQCSTSAPTTYTAAWCAMWRAMISGGYWSAQWLCGPKMPGSCSTSPRMFGFFVSLTGIGHCLHCTLTAGFTTSGCSMALKLAVTACNFVEERGGLYILNQNHDMSLQHVMVFTWKPTVVLHKTQTLQS